MFHIVVHFNTLHFAMILAITLDNANVKGHTAWSLMDNFEWGSGYTERFGLYWVDFNDPERPRIPKDSVSFYSSVASTNAFVRDLAEPWTHFATE